MMRRIRNDFAHSIEDETLSLGRHHDRLLDIVSVMSKTHMWSQFRPDFLGHIASGELRDFVKALTVLIAALEVTAWANGRLEPRMTTAIVFSEEEFKGGTTG